MPSKKPFVSVVVICYNGEATLDAALSSLMSQTYPKNRYEIIVVDDGSTDNSEAVASAYPAVKSVQLDKNKGIPSARNAGLRIAKGSIYAAFDCDCKADPDWLSQIVAGYTRENAIGVGSTIIEPEPIRRFATRYISICDSLFAPAADKNGTAPKGPLNRLISYVKLRIKTPVASSEPRVVSEIYGAGGTFRCDTLLAVGGWDETLNGIEDRDLSRRIANTFQGKQFYLMPDAKLTHERGESLWQYLMRPVKRGVVNFEFHRRNQLTPPIFPFPLLYLIICVASAFISPVTAIVLLALLPQLLYFWWPYKSIQRRQSILLLFPYIQLLEELMVIIGLADGYFKSLQRRRHNA